MPAVLQPTKHVRRKMIHGFAPPSVGGLAAAFSEKDAGLPQPGNFGIGRVLLGAVVGFADRHVDVQIWNDAVGFLKGDARAVLVEVGQNALRQHRRGLGEFPRHIVSWLDDDHHGQRGIAENLLILAWPDDTLLLFLRKQLCVWRQKRAVGTPLNLLGPALVANSWCRSHEKRKTRKPEIQIANSG